MEHKQFPGLSTKEQKTLAIVRDNPGLSGQQVVERYRPAREVLGKLEDDDLIVYRNEGWYLVDW